MNIYSAVVGAPILSPDRNEIWAYWAQPVTFRNGVGEFFFAPAMPYAARWQPLSEGREADLLSKVGLGLAFWSPVAQVWQAFRGAKRENFLGLQWFRPEPTTDDGKLAAAIDLVLADMDGILGPSVVDYMTHYAQYLRRRAER